MSRLRFQTGIPRRDSARYQRARRAALRLLRRCLFCLGPADRPGLLACTECARVQAQKFSPGGGNPRPARVGQAAGGNSTR